MIKKILIAGLIVGFLSSVGYAEVKKKVDSFDGSITITSEQRGDGRPLARINFIKARTSDGVSIYKLALFRIGGLCFFERVPLRMKIKEEIYNLPIVSTSGEYLTSDFYITYGTWIVSEEMKERILKADSITIRVNYRQQASTTLKIPSKMLDEWKQVIREKF